MKPRVYLETTIIGYLTSIAVVHGMDYLLTWNCKHLANANKFEHIRVLTARRGLASPAIVTPQQLLGVSHD